MALNTHTYVRSPLGLRTYYLALALARARYKSLARKTRKTLETRDQSGQQPTTVVDICGTQIVDVGLVSQTANESRGKQQTSSSVGQAVGIMSAHRQGSTGAYKGLAGRLAGICGHPQRFSGQFIQETGGFSQVPGWGSGTTGISYRVSGIFQTTKCK